MATDAHKEWVHKALGVKAAAGAGSKRASGGKGVKTINFDEDEGDVITVKVAKGLPGDTGEQEIKDQLQKLKDDIQDYWGRYARGIDLFAKAMQFSSEQEAEAQHLQAAFTAIGKKVLDMALDAAGEKLGGPWGIIISTTKSVVEAWAAEDERAAKAAGEVTVLKYITSITQGVDKQQKKMSDAVDAGTRPLLEQFQQLAKSDNLKGKASSDGVIVGEAAGVVNGVKAAVKAFEAKMPSTAFFQQAFTKAFADTPGMTDLVSHGGREAGKLYFEIHLYLETDGDKRKWSIDSDGTSPAWKLVTKQEHADRVAESLMLSLDGGKPWQIDLGKKVKITVETETFGPNDYKDCWIFFDKSPDQYSLGPFTDPKLAAEAWGLPMTRSRVLNTMKMVGSNE